MSLFSIKILWSLGSIDFLFLLSRGVHEITKRNLQGPQVDDLQNKEWIAGAPSSNQCSSVSIALLQILREGGKRKSFGA